MADDLDSFFQEINQVTAESAFAENSAYDLNADNYDESSATSGKLLRISKFRYSSLSMTNKFSLTVSNQVMSQVVISKPASGIASQGDVKLSVVESVVSHHPVYTYSFTPSTAASSSSSSTTFSDSTSAPAPSSSAYSNSSFSFKPPAPSVPYGSSQFSSHNAQSSAPLPPGQPCGTDKKFVRKAADEIWVDDTLKEWPDNDYRIFVGDLAKEVTTEMMAKTFQHYKSFAKAKVIDYFNYMLFSICIC